MKKIKVAEFVSRMEFGGVESFLSNYINHFNNKEDFDFHIITQDINDEKCIQKFEYDGFNVHIVCHKNKSIIRNCIEIYRILRKEKFDVVHCHMSLTNFYVLFLALLAGTKLRISHSHIAYNNVKDLNSKFLPFIKFLNKLFSNVWMACGKEAGIYMYGTKAINDNRVIIMKNAIEIEKFKFNPSIRKDMRRRLNLNDELCVGHVGRFTEQKNHAYLIEVFNELLKLDSRAKLLLVGSGENKEEIRKMVHKLEIDESVIFAGNVENTCDYYQAMDVFVLPSKYEGLPLSLIEAQASNIPCLVSDCIDKEAIINNNVHLLSLTTGLNEWTNRIISMNVDDRKNAVFNEILVNNVYDISLEVNKLESIYRTYV